MDEPDVSVIICTHNRGKMIVDCLGSVSRQTYPGEKTEVIVVDDGSQEKYFCELEEALEKHPHVKFCPKKHGGLSSARNYGAEKSHGEILVFTDDDIIMEEDYLEKIVAAYGPGVGGVGGKIISYTKENALEKFAEKHKILNQEVVVRTFLLGATSSYARRAYVEAGGFDSYFDGVEDMVIGIDVQRIGYQLKYAPDAILYHKHRSTLNALVKQQVRTGRGYPRLHAKYLRHFNPWKNLAIFIRRTISNTILFPIKSIKAGPADLKETLIDYILLVIVNISLFYGLLTGMVENKEYFGQTTNEKMQFIVHT